MIIEAFVIESGDGGRRIHYSLERTSSKAVMVPFESVLYLPGSSFTVKELEKRLTWPP